MASDDAESLHIAVHLHVGAGADDEYITVPRDAISCQLCEDPYGTEEPRTPCVLPCFHTFCRQCLRGWAADKGAAAGGFSCPTCRAGCAVAVEAVVPLEIQPLIIVVAVVLVVIPLEQFP